MNEEYYMEDDTETCPQCGCDFPLHSANSSTIRDEGVCISCFSKNENCDEW